MTRKQLDQLHRGIAEQNIAREQFESTLAGLGLMAGCVILLVAVFALSRWGII